MIFPLISLLFLVSAGKCLPMTIGNDTRQGRIYGGAHVDIKRVAYMVQVMEDDRLICGGSIIAKSWILSAAHCFEDTDESTLSIVIGSSNRGDSSEEGEEYDIEQIITHEYYHEESLDNDIALVKLTQPMKFNQAQRSIAIAKTPPKLGDRVLIAGFGETEDSDYSDYLKGALVHVVDHNLCQRKYNNEFIDITENMFCAAKRDTDSCKGDSGGPAVINGQLAGIVSFGDECASPYYPGVYTQVYRYRGWIKANTGLKI